MKPEIVVEGLRKVYQIPIREPGLAASVRSLVKPVYNEVPAVNGIDFQIEAGEMVGFIGPNGAGKTTTLKMLSGLLYPTSGKLSVRDFIPWQRKSEFLRQISMLMGNKTQLTWENTIMDSFIILKEIYGVSSKAFRERMDELVALLNIQELLPKLSRNLSLGERARCEFAAALIHQPAVMFLDEPTLGLDISMQIKLRDFIKEYNLRHGTTILITSHYMADIVSLSKRVIFINQGSVLFDGALADLAGKTAPYKLMRVKLGEGCLPDDDRLGFLNGTADVLEREGSDFTLRMKKQDIVHVTGDILSNLPVADLTVEDPPIDAVIDLIYREGVK